MRAETASEDQLREFLTTSDFWTNGAVMTDLDGTAMHEERGHVVIAPTVEMGLKRLHELGRPFVLNSLRFPLSILRTFGREWYAVSNAPIPVVSLNGSLVGRVVRIGREELAFEEIDAFPLHADELDLVFDSVHRLLEAGIRDLLVFYYPRDWREGEIIWTPEPERTIQVKEKYVSASGVTAVGLPKLRLQMAAEEICMVFLLVDAPGDALMAYQHTKRSNFFTHQGVDKLSGARRIAESLGVSLEHSIGAGDTEMDTFLKEVGLAIHVGPARLPFDRLGRTIRLETSMDLGALLLRAAEDASAPRRN